MITKAVPRVIEATRMEGGVIITFADGKCAIYSPELLYEAYPNAQRIDPEASLPIP